MRPPTFTSLGLVVLAVGCTTDSIVTPPPTANPAIISTIRIVDEVNPVAPSPILSLAFGGPGRRALAQEIRPQLTGRLAVVALPVQCPSTATLTLEVRDVEPDGSPGTRVLATMTLPGREFSSSDPGHMVPIRVRPTVEVRQQKSYMIVVSAFNGPCRMGRANAGNSYPYGRGWELRRTATDWTLLSSELVLDDLAFLTMLDVP